MSTAKPPGQKRGHGDGAKPTLMDTGPLSMTAPEHLGPEGKAIWGAVCRQTSWLLPSDIHVLRLLADGADRRQMLVADVATRGPVVEARQGPLPNPALSALATLEKQMTQWMSLLGLTPSDRGRLGLSAAKAESTLERLRSQRGGAVQSDALQSTLLDVEPEVES
jgi:P27 family predicted phage terminase small subunit